MDRLCKAEILTKLRVVFSSKAFIITRIGVVDVEDITNMKKQLLPLGLRFVFAKNNFAKLVLNEMGVEGYSSSFQGKIVVFYAEDFFSLLSSVKDLTGQYKSLFELLDARFIDEYIDSKLLIRFADVSSVKDLQVQLVKSILHPVKSMIKALNFPAVKLTRALKAVSENKS